MHNQITPAQDPDYLEETSQAVQEAELILAALEANQAPSKLRLVVSC